MLPDAFDCLLCVVCIYSNNEKKMRTIMPDWRYADTPIKYTLLMLLMLYTHTHTKRGKKIKSLTPPLRRMVTATTTKKKTKTTIL